MKSFLAKLKHFIFGRKFLLNIILIIVLWIGIIWGSIAYFNSYTNHGESIVVPNLISNNVADISELLAGKDLKYEILDSIYNPDLVEGTIVYQNPMATDSTGLEVKSGRSIKVRVSKRSRLVDVPMVVSKSQRFAEAVLMTKGLRTKTSFIPSNEDQGSVIEQKYKGKRVTKDQKVPINSVIELVVGQKTSGEMELVPNLYGLTIKEAESRLNDIQSLRLFVVCNDCQNAQDSINARVIRQTPVAGDSSRIPKGSTITAFASTNFSPGQP
ncbi:MAG: PASTA domain-containing protein [Brumimicrobium sp.]|nr:PASTA domain-containing protein [Brumimicrobium sp.]